MKMKDILKDKMNKYLQGIQEKKIKQWEEINKPLK